MKFEEALKLLENGKKIRREEWNAIGYIYYDGLNRWKIKFQDEEEVTYGSFTISPEDVFKEDREEYLE